MCQVFPGIFSFWSLWVTVTPPRSRGPEDPEPAGLFSAFAQRERLIADDGLAALSESVLWAASVSKILLLLFTWRVGLVAPESIASSALALIQLCISYISLCNYLRLEGNLPHPTYSASNLEFLWHTHEEWINQTTAENRQHQFDKRL